MSDPLIQHIYLTRGWLPITVQVAAACTLVLTVAFRTRQWWLRCSPFALLGGAIATLGAWWYLSVQGLTGEPTPPMLWVWLFLSGVAVTLALVGWRSGRWFVRGASFLAVLCCVVAAALVVNLWTSYVLTLQGAWSAITAAPLPNEVDIATARSMAERGDVPKQGSIVRIDSGSAGSGFEHRAEFLYLPPIWFEPDHPPLPAVVMLGGAMTSSADWIRRGGATRTVDKFAAAHGGSAPILVFPDLNGMFDKDTECVNGTRGNSADHLVQDVVPYVVREFGAKDGEWGIAGWSMGGTCAVGLAMKYPELFSAFIDIAGDLGPNVGNKTQTIERLYGGDARAYDAFDPRTILQGQTEFDHLAGWFAVPSDNQAAGQLVREIQPELPTSGNTRPDSLTAANWLCGLGRAKGMKCTGVVHPGQHDWQFGVDAFREAFPWLAGELAVPNAPRVDPPLGQWGR